MIELNKEQAPALADLFHYTEETVIRSFTQGHMGRGWVDRYPDPTCGRITAGDFTFLAGDHTCPGAEEIVRGLEKTTLTVPQNEEWAELIKRVYGEKAVKVTRYAIKKEPDVFDRKKLEGFVAKLPEGYELKQIDGEAYRLALQDSSTKDLCGNFDSEEDFLKRGLGFCIMHDGILACGASSYTMYTEGIEIEIITNKNYRRKGLATICGARLILECLDRGLYPSWDAANLESVGLSEKLGYHFDYEYDTYVVMIDEKEVTA